MPRNSPPAAQDSPRPCVSRLLGPYSNYSLPHRLLPLEAEGQGPHFILLGVCPEADAAWHVTGCSRIHSTVHTERGSVPGTEGPGSEQDVQTLKNLGVYLVQHSLVINDDTGPGRESAQGGRAGTRPSLALSPGPTS